MTELIVADVPIADVLIVDVLIVYHGGYGQTARQAAAVHEGAASIFCVRARKVQVADVDANALVWFERADAIVFGASSPNLVADGNEISLAREIPAPAQVASA
ncbi:hypothetical protein [Panacagrimonas sp.]|uniref:hypothetical protein n=1 Tax=Panacagrimonas sp. TaxID=2480088 RepID=UPI003B5269B6